MLHQDLTPVTSSFFGVDALGRKVYHISCRVARLCFQSLVEARDDAVRVDSHRRRTVRPCSVSQSGHFSLRGGLKNVLTNLFPL